MAHETIRFERFTKSKPPALPEVHDFLDTLGEEDLHKIAAECLRKYAHLLPPGLMNAHVEQIYLYLPEALTYCIIAQK